MCLDLIDFRQEEEISGEKNRPNDPSLPGVRQTSCEQFKSPRVSLFDSKESQQRISAAHPLDTLHGIHSIRNLLVRREMF